MRWTLFSHRMFSFQIDSQRDSHGIAKRVTPLRRCENIRSLIGVLVLRRLSECMAEQIESTVLRARLSVKGTVQGVGYRAFAARVASQRGLCGGVRNLDDGRVKLEVEGRKDQILSLIEDLKSGPPAARVTAINVEWSPATGRFSDFQVWY